MDINGYCTAALTAFETTRSKRPPSSPDGRVVRMTQTSFFSGSAQATVPVAPLCPKVRGEHRSPKYDHTREVANPHPRPHGAPTCAFWSRVIAATVAGLKILFPLNDPQFKNVCIRIARSVVVE
jgi:hypothetical protein